MFYRLNCGYQNYDWGKLGDTSAVAKFAATNDNVKIDVTKPYAELWMGSHPKVPSVTIGEGADGSNLRELCSAHPDSLGEKVIKAFGPGELPYLFKVLSIGKALSIQAHPDKALAKILRERDPKNYPDDNHKPEMAVALTDFEGFCGFRPVEEIKGFLQTVPEFQELVGKDVVEQYASLYQHDSRKALRVVFSAVMNASDQRVAELAPKLAARAASEGEKFGGGLSSGAGKPLADLIVRVDKQFPQDVGLFCGGLMLNYVTLNEGEAMFLRAKDPHAYISGDIIECMAASDNVVRAGFTPKFKDVPTLVDMLTYDCAPVEEQKMVPAKFSKAKGGSSLIFNPPIDEFAVVQQTNQAGEQCFWESLTGASLIIVTQGSGYIHADGNRHPYETGYVFFVGAGTEIEIRATTKSVSYHAIAEI